MLFRVRSAIKKKWFGVCCRDILSTPPVKIRENNLIIVSMISHLDLIQYLVAIKSLYNKINSGQIVIISDGSLIETDLEVLRTHVSPIEIVNVNDVNTKECPRGGTWERLFIIANYVQDNYVIQLDSDTITLNEIPEVLNYIGKNHSFLLGTEYGQNIVKMEEARLRMKNSSSKHIQALAEINFNLLKNYSSLKYARGCSAFTGFAKNSFSEKTIVNFSLEMEKILGEKWHSWGTEQVTSNFIISNSAHPNILPFPKYRTYYFKNSIPYIKSSFLHFIGTDRFKKGVYLKTARTVIANLKDHYQG